MTSTLNTIREALIHAYEESIYVSSWRKYRDALVALNHIASSLASYRSTTETMLGIEIPESEGLLGFVPCLMRAAKDRQTVPDVGPCGHSWDRSLHRACPRCAIAGVCNYYNDSVHTIGLLAAERDQLRAELQRLKNGGGW